jgi:SnoaL-like polyketide cyclase
MAKVSLPRPARTVVHGLAVFVLSACAGHNSVSDAGSLERFAARYTAAWCSHRAEDVAAFYGEQGSLRINDGVPAKGRMAIAAAAQSFMTTFPDIVVTMDRLVVNGDRREYHWTLTGTNTGPGGTGKFVRISGYEDWRFRRPPAFSSGSV